MWCVGPRVFFSRLIVIGCPLPFPAPLPCTQEEKERLPKKPKKGPGFFHMPPILRAPVRVGCIAQSCNAMRCKRQCRREWVTWTVSYSKEIIKYPKIYDIKRVSLCLNQAPIKNMHELMAKDNLMIQFVPLIDPWCVKQLPHLLRRRRDKKILILVSSFSFLFFLFLNNFNN